MGNYTYREDFTSIGKAVGWAEDGSNPKPNYQARHAMPDEAWDFGAGWEGALNLARKGWAEGAAQVAALARTLVERVDARVQPLATAYSDAGGFSVDVARFISGEPEHYLEFADTPTPKPVTLTVNVTASHTVSADRMFYRGAVVLAAAEILTARGFAVTIRAKVVNRSSAKADRNNLEPVYVATVNVHEAGDAFDVDAVAFALCHPAFTRRVCFGLKESTPARVRKALIQFRKGWATGYGMPADEAADLYSKLYEPMMWLNKFGGGNAHRLDSEVARVERVLEICEAAGAEVRA